MRAVAYQKSLPIEDEHALVDVDLPTPAPQGRDLLVQVQAVSVNPVDTKVRKRHCSKPAMPFSMRAQLDGKAQTVSFISSMNGSSAESPTRSTGQKRQQ